MNQTTTSANGPATMKVKTFFTYYKPHAIRTPIFDYKCAFDYFVQSNLLKNMFEAYITSRGQF